MIAVTPLFRRAGLLLGFLALAGLAPLAPAADPEPAVDPRTGTEWVSVPAGELRMGSTEEDDDAQPVHRVRLSAFRMGRTEVTNAQYERFMTETGRSKPAHWKEPRFGAPAQPVLGVNWDDAAAFCRWAGGRLPTEAEWEYAARGPEGRRYPWGDEEPDPTRAVFHLDVGFGGTKPVAGTGVPAQRVGGAGPFGVLDLAGNVFEWCADWYDPGYYARSPVQDPPGPSSGELRVVRGGGWLSLPDACRGAARAKYAPASRSVMIGIRVVRTAAL